MNYPNNVNVKTLFVHLLKTLDALDRHEIDVNQAAAIAKIHQQCNNYLNYELKRAITSSRPEVKSEMRNLEIKNFDSLPE